MVRTTSLLLPAFRRFANEKGEATTIMMGDSPEAVKLCRQREEEKKRTAAVRPVQSRTPGAVVRLAVEAVRRLGGDVSNRQHVLGQCEFQLGLYRNKTFRWILSNALGYAAYVAVTMVTDHDYRHSDVPLSANKLLLKEYLESFREGREAIAHKRSQAPRVPACLAPPTPSPPTTAPQSTSASPAPPAPGSQKARQGGFPLSQAWRDSLPKVDRAWVSKAFFRWSSSNPDTPELDYSRIHKLWWYPAEPALIHNLCPRIDRYFGHRLFVWMPKRLWKYVLMCPHSDCTGVELNHAGSYPIVKKVLDVDGYYLMVTEYLQCPDCKRKVIPWSAAVLAQLDVGHRSQFPAIPTYKYFCDKRVVRMLRQRGLGNGPVQLWKTIREQHEESWLERTIQFLTDRKAFVSTTTQPCPRPPSMDPVRGHQWFLRVYGQDVLGRIDEVKAAITSTFGTVLKLDSTKKVARKLAGHGARTAEWASNVGNEHGQVLISVLTAKEGCGLANMASGLVDRYAKASIEPPQLLYVDRDCCSGATHAMFGGWPDLQIRLDIWHFMRRLASGCTTDAHPLYSLFMSRLSQCIFQWDEADHTSLKTAKRVELVRQGFVNPSDQDVISRISRRELALHCRRATRSTDDIQVLIQQLLDALGGEQGVDTMGVPLFNTSRMMEEWLKAKHHIPCLQDPPGIELYTVTGTMQKGGQLLNTYRCARGSTSLESFHLHLNRFIPGSTASDLHFQAYLVEGLARWNQDRAQAATSVSSKPGTYSRRLLHVANQLSAELLDEPLYPDFSMPNKHTGELIGVEYLYSQTGRALQYVPADTEDAEKDDAGDDDEEEESADEGFHDLTEVDDMTMADASMVVSANRPLSAFASATSQPPSFSSALTKWDDPIPLQTPTAPFTSSLPPPHLPPPTPTASSLPPPHLPPPTPTYAAGRPPSISATFSLAVSADQPDDSLLDPVPELLKADPDQCLGPDGVPGFEKVSHLANFLVGLRDQVTPLTNGQVSEIVCLWYKMDAIDQRPSVIAPRFHPSPKGRFKASKGSFIPGVECVKKCLLGSNSGPAQRPDCNRYMEAVISILCDTFPSHVVVSGTRVLRWTLILRAYSRIQTLVMDHPSISSGTGLQLLAVNQATLTDWCNRRSKKREATVLQQGLACPTPSMTAPHPLPPARLKPTALPSGNAEEHSFTLPVNTAGMAKQRKKASNKPAARRATPIPIFPGAPPLQVGRAGVPILFSFAQNPTATATATLPPFAPTPSTSQQQDPSVPLLLTTDPAAVPASTLFYRRKRLQQEEAGTVQRDRYTKRKCSNRCRLCGEEKTGGSQSHQQYYGHVWCQATSGLEYQTWLAELKERGVGKKKNNN